MSQLSGHDATFLYSDTAHSNSNVSLLHIYDQSTAPGGKVRFKTILAHIESRLDRSPVFRRRLQRVPLELDYPYWVEDENFDLEYHVRHIALPKPGDWRQFCIQASRIHARPLDLKRPLWEIYVIEGLDSFLDLPQGSFAVLTKTHHAAIDVESGSEITMLLHDTTPTPPARGAAGAVVPRVAARARRRCCAAAWSTRSISPFRLARPLTRALTRYAPTAFALAGDILLRPESMPPTRFNSVVSPHRVFETRRFTLDEFKAIRALVRGATVNDAVLAVCGGALRRYLGDKDELPEASLTAMAPFYIRGADAGERRQARHVVAARAARHAPRRPGAAPRLRARPDGLVGHRGARRRRPRADRHRPARAGGDAGADEQDARPRVARHRAPRAAGQLHDHQRARAPRCRCTCAAPA